MFDPVRICEELNEEVREGLLVVVASLDDIIDSKRAADRPNDQRALPYRESLRAEIERRA